MTALTVRWMIRFLGVGVKRFFWFFGAIFFGVVMKRLFSRLFVLVCSFLMVFGSHAQAASQKESAGYEVMTQELKIIDQNEGTGRVAESGDIVRVHYVGTLENGKQFDSSLGRGVPLEFQLGVGQVISGWDQGVVGMKEGGKRKLIIPPALAYGDRSVGSIPPNSTLIFQVELLEVK